MINLSSCQEYFLTTYRNKLPLVTKNITWLAHCLILRRMKRTIILSLVVALICWGGFAGESQEEVSTDFNYRTVSGGFWSCGQDFSGGLGEFGINLLPCEKSFVLRDCIYVQGEGGSLDMNNKLSFGALEIGDKLILGGRVYGQGFIVRSYGFTACAIGLFACEGHTFFERPFMINLTFGGGFEFQFSKNTAFVLEFGGINRFLARGDKKTYDYFSKSSPVLTIGYRTFRR